MTTCCNSPEIKETLTLPGNHIDSPGAVDMVKSAEIWEARIMVAPSSGGMTYIVTRGGSGGTPFDLQAVRGEVGLSGGNGHGILDVIWINGVQFGQSKGESNPDHFVFESDEYINQFVLNGVPAGYVDYFSFTTNKGRGQSVGNPGQNADTQAKHDNVRVLSIGGRAYDYVDQLQIEYEQL